MAIIYNRNQIKKKEVLIKHLVLNNKSLNLKIKQLTKELSMLKKTCTCNLPIDKKILKTDKDVNFYTGIKTRELFDKILEFTKPIVRRKWRGPSFKSTIVRSFKKSPKKIGPKPKLSCREEFLLCLMKIRLGLLHEDLANRFGISKTLVSRIFSTWVKATASVLKSFVFIPDMEKIAASRPKKFHKFPKLHSILDATEIFLQTPKNHAAQRITWSNYKHHNTAKV